MQHAAMKWVMGLGLTIAFVSPTLGASMMERWNDRVHGISIPTPDGQSNWTFFWDEINNFPHPTFKGGSEPAYQAFGRVLVEFLEDEFSYLQHHHLFTYPLIAQFPSGEIGVSTTFEALTADLSRSGLVDESLRAQLQHLHQRILEATQP
jgi:hypothetical protein